MMKLKKGMKIDAIGGEIEVLEEFTVEMNIKKGTKAAICKRGNNYFVCNCNQKCKVSK